MFAVPKGEKVSVLEPKTPRLTLTIYSYDSGGYFHPRALQELAVSISSHSFGWGKG